MLTALLIYIHLPPWQVRNVANFGRLQEECDVMSLVLVTCLQDSRALEHKKYQELVTISHYKSSPLGWSPLGMTQLSTLGQSLMASWDAETSVLQTYLALPWHSPQAKYKGKINLPEFKAVTLASLRSLLPAEWDSDHEAWRKIISAYFCMLVLCFWFSTETGFAWLCLALWMRFLQWLWLQYAYDCIMVY